MNNLIAKLRQKKNSKKGFTLMEMLIVVAIIAILVAVSIPVFNAQLENAKKATDDANMRAARATAVAMWLTSQSDSTKKAPSDTETPYYDAVNGKFLSSADAKSNIKEGYGKYAPTSGDTHVGKIIKVNSVSTDGVYELVWADIPK